MQKKNQIQILFVAFLVGLAVLSRFVSHQWNFTLMGAVALFAGAFFTEKKWAAVTLIISLLISDFVIGFHNQMFAVYSGFLVMVLIGFFLNMNSSRLHVIATSVLGSFLFFLITNFSVWAENILYPQTLKGLSDCFIMAVPFFRNQLFSDVIFSFLFFEVAKVSLQSITKNAPGNHSEIFDILKIERKNY